MDQIIRFRGVFVVVLNEGEGKKSARILFPNGVSPRLASGNGEHRIATHYPYVAVPLRRTDKQFELPLAVRGREHYQPNFIGPVDTHEHPYAPPVFPLSSRMPGEMIHATDRIAGGVSNTNGTLYAVYLAPQHEIRFRGFVSGGMSWDDRDVDPSAVEPRRPKPHPKSMKWSAELTELLGAKLRDEFVSDSVPVGDCAAFVDLDSGDMTPVHDEPDRYDHVHEWRFMHTTKPKRLLPDGVEVTLQVEDSPVIELRDRLTGEITTIPIDGADGMIVVGNEAAEDVLRVTPLHSCADPDYTFELTYRLCEPIIDRPVPVCADAGEYHVYRDPPQVRCSPYTVVRTGSPSSERLTARFSADDATRPKGFAVHLAINDYAANGSAFAIPDLRSAIYDAEALAKLTDDRGFTPFSKGSVLRDKDANRQSLLDAIAEARLILKDGDYFLASFNGHGFRVGRHSGWQLFRDSLSFSALFAALSTLPAGVRVLIVSAACYSGTVTNERNVRELSQTTLASLFLRPRLNDAANDATAFQLITMQEIGAFLRNASAEAGGPIFAHLAACGPDQRIPDGPDDKTHCDFARELLRLLQDPRSFENLELELRNALPATQQPEIRRHPELLNGFPQEYEAVGAFRIE